MYSRRYMDIMHLCTVLYIMSGVCSALQKAETESQIAEMKQKCVQEQEEVCVCVCICVHVHVWGGYKTV